MHFKTITIGPQRIEVRVTNIHDNMLVNVADVERYVGYPSASSVIEIEKERLIQLHTFELILISITSLRCREPNEHCVGLEFSGLHFDIILDRGNISGKTLCQRRCLEDFTISDLLAMNKNTLSEIEGLSALLSLFPKLINAEEVKGILLELHRGIEGIKDMIRSGEKRNDFPPIYISMMNLGIDKVSIEDLVNFTKVEKMLMAHINNLSGFDKFIIGYLGAFCTQMAAVRSLILS